MLRNFSSTGIVPETAWTWMWVWTHRRSHRLRRHDCSVRRRGLVSPLPWLPNSTQLRTERHSRVAAGQWWAPHLHQVKVDYTYTHTHTLTHSSLDSVCFYSSLQIYTHCINKLRTFKILVIHWNCLTQKKYRLIMFYLIKLL